MGTFARGQLPTELETAAWACCSFSLSVASVLCCLPVSAADSAIDADSAVMPDAVGDPYRPLAGHARFLNHGAALHEESTADSYGYAWRGVPSTQPDWSGVGRDTAYFLGYQFAAIALLYIAPESISGWDREQKQNCDFDKWRNNVSEPVWDDDRWWINYILHPYWGGTYYVRGRERGLDQAYSFLYSALLSTLYEYVPRLHRGGMRWRRPRGDSDRQRRISACTLGSPEATRILAWSDRTSGCTRAPTSRETSPASQTIRRRRFLLSISRFPRRRIPVSPSGTPGG